MMAGFEPVGGLAATAAQHQADRLRRRDDVQPRPRPVPRPEAAEAEGFRSFKLFCNG
jgi:hypothetical protein